MNICSQSARALVRSAKGGPEQVIRPEEPPPQVDRDAHAASVSESRARWLDTRPLSPETT